jgi:hypothetical protein
MTDDTLDPREAARIRRRDRELAAEAKALMRPGMGKVFKQIGDAQRRAADADVPDPAAASQATSGRRRRAKS